MGLIYKPFDGVFTISKILFLKQSAMIKQLWGLDILELGNIFSTVDFLFFIFSVLNPHHNSDFYFCPLKIAKSI